MTEAVNADDLSTGAEVSLTFIRESEFSGSERTTVETTVEDVCGKVVTLANPYGEDDPKMVVDPENDVWAREDGEDGYFGRNAQISLR